MVYPAIAPPLSPPSFLFLSVFLFSGVDDAVFILLASGVAVFLRSTGVPKGVSMVVVFVVFIVPKIVMESKLSSFFCAEMGVEKRRQNNRTIVV